MEKLLTIKETAELLSKNPATIRTYVKDGRIEAINLSKEGGYSLYRIPLSQFIAKKNNL